jgi:hypothetical protein
MVPIKGLRPIRRSFINLYLEGLRPNPKSFAQKYFKNYSGTNIKVISGDSVVIGPDNLVIPYFRNVFSKIVQILSPVIYV